MITTRLPSVYTLACICERVLTPSQLSHAARDEATHFRLHKIIKHARVYLISRFLTDQKCKQHTHMSLLQDATFL